MTNPTATIRLLVTYGILVPVAMIAGYFLVNAVNSPNYGTLGVLGAVIALMLMPVFIKWHYPILLCCLWMPIHCFFLKGNPPIWQVAVILSFGIAIVERALSARKRFISPPSMTWPLIYTVAMALLTAKLTGGIGLHALGGGEGNDVGGGKKYIFLFLAAVTFFALTSRVIPKERRIFYLCLYFLPAILQFMGDLVQVLPGPLQFIGLLISSTQSGDETGIGSITRFLGFGFAGNAVVYFMLAMWGVRGIFASNQSIWRIPLFLAMVALSLVGGHRIVLLGIIAVFGLMFFLEGLHRTQAFPIFLFIGVICITLLVPFSDKLPYTIQRSLAVLPLNLDPAAVMDAQGSSEWRLRIWRDTWPKVPQYLLLGKGYALTATDFAMMGRGMFANGAEAHMDASQEGLAISGDYHNGPLSVLMPFGIWGAISYLAVTLAGLRILYRNFKYGDPELRVINIFFLANALWNFICFLTVFGSYTDSIFATSCATGISIALNGGICGSHPKPVSVLPGRTILLRRPQPQPI